MNVNVMRRGLSMGIVMEDYGMRATATGRRRIECLPYL